MKASKNTSVRIFHVSGSWSFLQVLDLFASFFSLHSLMFQRHVVLWLFSFKLHSKKHHRNCQPSNICSHAQLKPIRIPLCCLDRHLCEADLQWFLPGRSRSQEVLSKKTTITLVSIITSFLNTWGHVNDPRLSVSVCTIERRSVKDHGDTSSRLLERRIWLVCIKALLLAVM